MIPSKELVYADLMRSKGQLNGTYSRTVEMEIKARNELLSWCSDAHVKSIDPLPTMQMAIARHQQLYPTSTESHPDAVGYAVIAAVVNYALNNETR
jgi:hypothetical protein